VITLQIRTKIKNDITLAERSIFQVDNKFFQKKDGMAMGSSLSPLISNTYEEHFEKVALNSVQHKPLLWLWYVDDTFVVCLMAVTELH
jgi:hypothetical protein